MFGDTLENLRNFGEIVSFLRKSFHSILTRLRTSKKKSEVLTTNKNGLSEATTASEVKYVLRFQISDLNYICNQFQGISIPQKMTVAGR